MGLENVKMALTAQDIGSKEGDGQNFTIEGEVKDISTKFGPRYVFPLKSTELGEVEFFGKASDAQRVIRAYGAKLKEYLGKEIRLVLQPYEFEKDGESKKGLKVVLEIPAQQ